jgi:putative intracellular protease/amidase
MLTLAVSRRQDKPTPRFASGDLFIGGRSLREGDDAVDLRRLECALLEHGRERLEEFASPYYTFNDAGAEIVIASPKGGQALLDPKTNEPNFQTDLAHRFEADADAQARLATTARLDGVKAEDFDSVFCLGGHGPMWDLAEDQTSVKLIETMFRAGKPVALVCHAPGALCHAKTSGGKPLVQGKRVSGFTNTEEEPVRLTKVVPFLVEDELKAKGGIFSKAADWQPYVLTDGLLITGQNPASSGPAAKVLIETRSH